METNELKNVWKSQINSSIKEYSSEELSVIVVKAAKKSIKTMRPNIILKIIVGVVIIYLIWSMIAGNHSTGFNILSLTALLILVASYFYLERSVFKLNKPEPDISVREWMKYRLDEMEKSVKFHSKHDFFIFGGSFLLGYVFYLMFQILANVSLTWISVVIFICLFIYTLIIRHYHLKKINKILKELRELYMQLDEE